MRISDWSSDVCSSDLAAEPGSRFLYSTGESNMVGIIVSRAVGEPLADYLSRKIWAPYGLESDASWLTDGGTAIGGGWLNVTPRDYGRRGLFTMEAIGRESCGARGGMCV